MKNLITAVFIVGLLSITLSAYADDTVDLSDKKGVVDPKDLKKDDPKEKPITIKEPPPPDTKTDEEFTVHKTGEGHGGIPTSGGFEPPLTSTDTEKNATDKK